MLAQNNSRINEHFKVYVVRTIDDAVAETYVTGVRDHIQVPLNEAQRALGRLGNGHYIATDDSIIAEELGIPVYANRSQVQNRVYAMLKEFEVIRKKTNNDQYIPEGRNFLKNKLTDIMMRGTPINFVLPAFPAKSPNVVKKCLGHLQDKAEEVSLKFLHDFAIRASEIYDPGVTITIINDGLIYCDLLSIPTDNVREYRSALIEMYRRITNGIPKITFLSLSDLLQQQNNAQLIEQLMQKYGPESHFNYDSDSVAHLYDPETFACIKLFVLDDITEKFPSRNQLKKKASKITAEMMHRKYALDKLIESQFPDSIRLSIHAHPNNTGKIGINLIPGENTPTPWHNVLVMHENGRIEFTSRQNAERNGYTLLYENGLPSYFKA